MAEPRLHQYNILFQKANADVHLAIRARQLNDEQIDNATLLFHLQQAAEKYLKAILSYNNCHFEKIHDLAELIKLCKTNGIPLPEYAMSFIELNPFAVIGRYDLVSDDDIDFEGKAELISKFSEWVNGQLK
jgi:HEPN domain-containing protein